MEQTGEYRIAADREVVWAALNDPDVLARCIDGCQSMEQTADDRFDARVKAKVGPVRATFDAQLTLQDIVPPESYTIAASVKGGPAGFARGSADVKLTEDDGGTLLQYAVHASVGGKLAQVGSRLIDGAARKMADDFFAAFHRELGGGEDVGGSDIAAGEAGVGAQDPTAPGVAPIEDERGYEASGRWMIWVAAFLALALALLFAF